MTKYAPADFQTYLKMIEGSVGANTWRHGMAYVDGQLTDMTNNGELSCVLFISSILKIFDVIETYHANVDSTLRDMERSGWTKVDQPEPGDVVVLGPKPDGEQHLHPGFYIGDEKIVVNNYVRSQPEKGGCPEVVDWLHRDHPDGERPLVAIYRGKHLFKSI